LGGDQQIVSSGHDAALPAYNDRVNAAAKSATAKQSCSRRQSGRVLTKNEAVQSRRTDSLISGRLPSPSEAIWSSLLSSRASCGMIGHQPGRASMQLHDFISAAQIEALPDDDPQEAFTQFVRICATSLGEEVERLGGDEQHQWQAINDARHGFMNVVVAAAKKFDIQPMASMEVPRADDYDGGIFRQFKADLDHYITQLVLENSSRSKRDSVYVTPDLKAQISTYVYHLRQLIQKAEGLSDEKRESLLVKLADFEAELEKRRLNLLTVALMVIALASAPGGIWATGEAGQKIVSNILKVVGEAKNADDDAKKRLAPAETPRAISPPRQPTPSRPKTPAARNSDMNDDIPF